MTDSPSARNAASNYAKNSARIAVIGAFDRFNYGDVLFTSVARHVFSLYLPGSHLSFHAMRRIDMTALGGENTRPLSEIYRRVFRSAHPLDAIFVAGGDVLGARWSDLAGHILPSWAERPYRRIYRRLGEQRVSRLSRLALGCPSLLPFVVDPDDLPGAPPPRVLYNAVGGSQIPGTLSQTLKASLAKVLGRADWLSVRDDFSRKALSDIGVHNVEVLPDSAVVMADLIDASELRRRRRAILTGAGLSPDEPYICVQSAEHLLAGREAEFADEVATMHRRHGVQVIAFAIGRVMGHNDHRAARRLAEQVGRTPWFGVADDHLGVMDIMALIAGAEAYLGTSLHGYLTAFAFGRPRVGLAPSVIKLVGFRDTWDLPTMPAGLPFATAAEGLDIALATDRTAMEAQAKAVSDVYRAGVGKAIGALLPQMER